MGTCHVCMGGSIPSWLKRERESGMLISDMYLETDDFIVYIFLGNFCTYFQFPLMFLTKELGTPYQVSAFPVGAPNRGWWTKRLIGNGKAARPDRP